MPSDRQALAFSHTYALFAQLYLRGPVAELRTYVQAIPELSAALEDKPAAEHAADHYGLFGLNVFPYESVFLDPANTLGGAVTHGVAGFYAQAGFECAENTADHLGCELALLSFLCAAEVEAGNLPEQERARGLQQHFLHRHLLRWLPAFVQAVRQQGQAFYRALAALTLEVVCSHVETLGAGLTFHAPFVLPDPPALLDDPHTGLKEIAAYLTTPAHSGLFLSRDDIGRLGRGQNLPRGFGGRRQMLTNLLRAAAEYDRLPHLLADLRGLTGEWAAFWGEMATRPGLAAIAAVWGERLEATQDCLERIAAALKSPPAV